MRSNPDFLTSDIRRSLGFVASPRRFNGTFRAYNALSFLPIYINYIVAISRAQALLIIVGNADVLALDPVWRSFMNYIHNGGGWRGRPISWDPEANVDDYVEGIKRRAAGEDKETIERLKALVVGVSEGNDVVPHFDGDDEEIDGELGDGLVIREVD